MAEREAKKGGPARKLPDCTLIRGTITDPRAAQSREAKARSTIRVFEWVALGRVSGLHIRFI